MDMANTLVKEPAMTMKLPSEFDTLALANAYEYEDYVNITSNEAEQFFQLTGQIKNLKDNLNNETPVELIAGLPTTIGMVIEAIINTMGKSNGVFSIKPTTNDGQLNRLAAAKLVEHGVLIQAVIDGFFAMGTKVTKPYEFMGQEEFDVHKGTITPTAVTPEYLEGTADYIINKYNKKISLLIEPTAFTQNDVLTVTVKSSNGSEPYAGDDTPRQTFNIPANNSEPQRKTVNVSGHVGKLQFEVTSKYGRAFTAKASYAV